MNRWIKVLLPVLLLIAACTAALADSDQPSAAVRHGTLFVRIPDSYIQEEMSTAEHDSIIWENYEITTRDTNEIERIARSLLNDSEYETFRFDMADGNTDKYTANYAFATPEKYNCIMNVRRCGDAWYSIVRLNDDLSGKQELWWYFDQYEMEMVNGSMTCKQTGDHLFSMSIDIENSDNQDAEWSSSKVSVYKTLGTNLMVLVEPKNSEPAGNSTDLYVNGERIPLMVPLNSYETSKGKHVYCAVLSDKEAGQIENSPDGEQIIQLKAAE